MKTNKLLIFCAFCSFLLPGCVFNINETPDCLECSYRNAGRVISEQLCEPFFDDSEKAEMRVRLQRQADSLQVTLTCDEF